MTIELSIWLCIIVSLGHVCYCVVLCLIGQFGPSAGEHVEN